MKRFALYFTAPGKVEIREEPVEELKKGYVLVKTLLSAISAGTELLVYRGQVPPDLRIDESLPGYENTFSYPCKYGYATVGEVIAEGPGVTGFADKKIFAFHPHESCFTVLAENVLPLPPGLDPTEAVLFPFMETALSLVMDAHPLIGERVVVFGQGVIGLLVTALLDRFPLAGLYTVDRHESRRGKSLFLGANVSFDPGEETELAALEKTLWHDGRNGADLSFELSGNPQALDEAIKVTGFDGRVIMGSWYGTRRSMVDLGGSFHRRRIKLISSQVSSIDPFLTGRWDKKRRTEITMRMIGQILPAQSLAQKIPFVKAGEAYSRLDHEQERLMQVILTYEE